MKMIIIVLFIVVISIIFIIWLKDNKRKELLKQVENIKKNILVHLIHILIKRKSI